MQMGRQEKDDSLVHKSFEVNEYLVKSNPQRAGRRGRGSVASVET